MMNSMTECVVYVVDEVHHVFPLSTQGFTDQQLSLVGDNTAVIEERDKQIRSIVQSISELNEIFRDLADMVVEQVMKYCVHSLDELWKQFFFVGDNFRQN
eukprot:m.59617 g.59617  ORF g.59617 m.59617 type:complete len:100 (+) comp34889_c0_seq23:768-1067(+)